MKNSDHRLQKARPGAVFVNVSRGEQSPAADLLRLLNEKHLAGLGLDVFNPTSLRHSRAGGNPVHTSLINQKTPINQSNQLTS